MPVFALKFVKSEFVGKQALRIQPIFYCKFIIQIGLYMKKKCRSTSKFMFHPRELKEKQYNAYKR